MQFADDCRNCRLSDVGEDCGIRDVLAMRCTAFVPTAEPWLVSTRLSYR